MSRLKRRPQAPGGQPELLRNFRHEPTLDPPVDPPGINGNFAIFLTTVAVVVIHDRSPATTGSLPRVVDAYLKPIINYLAASDGTTDVKMARIAYSKPFDTPDTSTSYEQDFTSTSSVLDAMKATLPGTRPCIEPLSLLDSILMAVKMLDIRDNNLNLSARPPIIHMILITSHRAQLTAGSQDQQSLLRWSNALSGIKQQRISVSLILLSTPNPHLAAFFEQAAPSHTRTQPWFPTGNDEVYLSNLHQGSSIHGPSEESGASAKTQGKKRQRSPESSEGKVSSGLSPRSDNVTRISANKRLRPSSNQPTSTSFQTQHSALQLSPGPSPEAPFITADWDNIQHESDVHPSHGPMPMPYTSDQFAGSTYTASENWPTSGAEASGFYAPLGFMGRLSSYYSLDANGEDPYQSFSSLLSAPYPATMSGSHPNGLLPDFSYPSTSSTYLSASPTVVPFQSLPYIENRDISHDQRLFQVTNVTPPIQRAHNMPVYPIHPQPHSTPLNTTGYQSLTEGSHPSSQLSRNEGYDNRTSLATPPEPSDVFPVRIATNAYPSSEDEKPSSRHAHTPTISSPLRETHSPRLDPHHPRNDTTSSTSLRNVEDFIPIDEPNEPVFSSTNKIGGSSTKVDRMVALQAESLFFDGNQSRTLRVPLSVISSPDQNVRAELWPTPSCTVSPANLVGPVLWKAFYAYLRGKNIPTCSLRPNTRFAAGIKEFAVEYLASFDRICRLLIERNSYAIIPFRVTKPDGPPGTGIAMFASIEQGGAGVALHAAFFGGSPLPRAQDIRRWHFESNLKGSIDNNQTQDLPSPSTPNTKPSSQRSLKSTKAPLRSRPRAIPTRSATGPNQPSLSPQIPMPQALALPSARPQQVRALSADASFAPFAHSLISRTAQDKRPSPSGRQSPLVSDNKGVSYGHLQLRYPSRQIVAPPTYPVHGPNRSELDRSFPSHMQAGRWQQATSYFPPHEQPAP